MACYEAKAETLPKDRSPLTSETRQDECQLFIRRSRLPLTYSRTLDSEDNSLVFSLVFNRELPPARTERRDLASVLLVPRGRRTVHTPDKAVAVSNTAVSMLKVVAAAAYPTLMHKRISFGADVFGAEQ